jgi:hypothetical protein
VCRSAKASEVYSKLSSVQSTENRVHCTNNNVVRTKVRCKVQSGESDIPYICCICQLCWSKRSWRTAPSQPSTPLRHGGFQLLRRPPYIYGIYGMYVCIRKMATVSTLAAPDDLWTATPPFSRQNNSTTLPRPCNSKGRLG